MEWLVYTSVAVRSPDIRERFLDFFASRGHQRLSSASLVAYDDPSLLFTSAGMVPLKPYILGLKQMPGNRAVSCQKCFRADDIEEVGDATHHTFFEMLGNWSFGDYFKEGAITQAWEFLTEGFGLDPRRLRPSVYPSDTEAEDIWVERIGIPREQVSRLEDNWWQAGPNGPCGYDSEIYWDAGAPCSCGRIDCTPQDECGGDRWIEIWNLVFMEFDQDAQGNRTRLARPTVDTGMGLERMASVLQGVRTTYETDLLAPLVRGFSERSDADASSAGDVRSLRVLADHLRAAAFLIADGVLPANEGRGYVLRRVIRRAAIHGGRIGLRGGLAAGVDDLVATMEGVYPELEEQAAMAQRTLVGEEANFERTLTSGVERLEALLAGGASHIGGADAFRLHDTYGFPIELTLELARERNVEVDLDGFNRAMEGQRERSRGEAVRSGFSGGPAVAPTTFVGYDTLDTDADVVHVDAGPPAVVVIEPSPFYAEAGGQVGDRGVIEHGSDSVRVLDTEYLPGGEVRASRVDAVPEWLVPGARVRARVDPARRAQTARHHSGTHLLNQALRSVLGTEVSQRGSLVESDHTTFDFSFPRALTPEEIEQVEHIVNDAIRRNLERNVDLLPLAEARAAGAIFMVGENYPDRVRVVSFGDFSRELCGGTHVARTGDLGAAIIVDESSIGQGLRRIEMLVGEAAERHWEESDARLREASRQLRSAPAELVDRVAAMQQQVKQLQRELAEARRTAAAGGGAQAEVEEVGGIRLAAVVGDLDFQAVQDTADAVFADRLQGDGVAVVLGNANALVRVSAGVRSRGLDAPGLLHTVNEVTGGRGGGRPDRAMGSLLDPAQRQPALDAVRQTLRTAGNAA